VSRGRQAGSATIAALVLLVLLAAVAGGGALVISGTLSRERHSLDDYALRKALAAEAERVAALLAEDPTPGADSPRDPVWDALASPALSEAADSLQDVSSALDPNWVQRNVFTKTGLTSLLKDTGSVDVLQQRRSDLGFFTNIEKAYGDLFIKDALEKYFTPYGYANINVTDEFALRRLYAIRTGDEAAADVFHARIQQLLIDQTILKPEDLRTFLGLDYDTLFPVMNAEPVMNAHFVDPLTLGELLAYPDLKVPHPQQAAQAILDMRDKVEMTAEQLQTLIGAPDTSRIYQYLGVTTWFWKVTVKKAQDTLDMIIARIPVAKDAKPRFTIVERRYTRG
jgi:hypothetical protein